MTSSVPRSYSGRVRGCDTMKVLTNGMVQRLVCHQACSLFGRVKKQVSVLDWDCRYNIGGSSS